MIADKAGLNAITENPFNVEKVCETSCFLLCCHAYLLIEVAPTALRVDRVIKAMSSFV